MQLAEYLESEIELDQPINIHLTGCHHSCAQHYIGDIGLIGAKVKKGDESLEGYAVVLGGGVDERQAIAHEVFGGIAFDDLKPVLLNVLKTYLDKREGKETFWQFSRVVNIRRMNAFKVGDAFSVEASCKHDTEV